MIAGIRTTFVSGTDFADFAVKGRLYSAQSLCKLRELIAVKDIGIIVLPITKSTNCIGNYRKDGNSSCDTPTDFEIESFIDYSHKNGVKVMLKPILKLNYPYDDRKSGLTEEWFDAYRDFALHISVIGSETGCSMLSLCQGIGYDRKYEQRWRELFNDLRESFNGFLTFTPQKFEEERIPFWESLDFISAADGYAPDNIKSLKARLAGLCQEYSKPVFICEKMQ